MEKRSANEIVNGREGGPRYWVFQANPARYRIHESLRTEVEELWNLNQHASEVHLGDRVAIWLSGAESGVYALGTVVSQPIDQPDSRTGQGYWRANEDGKKVKPRVTVRYDQVLVDRPLLKVFLEADPGLWDLRILRMPMGTNYPMTGTEWCALMSWVNGDE